jgi:hypothetical protein
LILDLFDNVLDYTPYDPELSDFITSLSRYFPLHTHCLDR